MSRYTEDHNHIIEQVPVDYYQNGVAHNYLQKIWHINKLNSVIKHIPYAPKKILDVGCASGWFLSRVFEKFPSTECCGIDVYEKGVTYGRNKYPHLSLQVADAHNIPYKSNTFDVVISTEVLEHVDDPRLVLLEIKRVLKDDGIAIIELDSGSVLFSIVWFLWRKINGRVWNDSHLHSFTVKKLEKIIKQTGFNILLKKRFNWGMAMVFVITDSD